MKYFNIIGCVIVVLICMFFEYKYIIGFIDHGFSYTWLWCISANTIISLVYTVGLVLTLIYIFYE